MTRWLRIFLVCAVTLAGVGHWAVAQDGPKADGDERPRTVPRREGRFPGRQRSGGSRRATLLRGWFKRDVEWVGKHDAKGHMTAWTTAVEQLLASDNPRDWIPLWQVHRRTQQWRQLADADRAKAFEEVHLEFESCRLAKEARNAEGDPREKLTKQLTEIAGRQLDLRIEVQKATLATHEKRLTEIEERLKTQGRLREELVAKRFEELTGSETELTDPLREVLAEPRGKGGDRADMPPERKADEQPAPSSARRGDRRGPRGKPDTDRKTAWYGTDLKWVEDHELGPIAARMRAARESATSDDFLLLWGVHRWIEQQKRIERSGGNLKESLEGVRLSFSIVEMAEKLRDPKVEDREALEGQLRRALGQQFEARQQRGRALLDIMRKELEKRQEGIQKQRKHRKRLIARRVQHLLDPERDPPEPELVPGEMHGPPHKRQNNP